MPIVTKRYYTHEREVIDREEKKKKLLDHLLLRFKQLFLCEKPPCCILHT